MENLWSAYRLAGKDERERTPQVREEDEHDGDQDHPAVDALRVGAVAEAKIADQQRDLEEADADLIDRSPGVVDYSEEFKILRRACLYRKSKSVFRLCNRKSISRSGFLIASKNKAPQAWTYGECK